MISSRVFYKKWVEHFRKNESKIIKNWNNKKEYTSSIRNLCDEISSELEMDTFHEYYSTDTIFFKKDGVERFGNGGVYIINPEIVFEHENECNSLKNEVAHNLIINSNLYVIVSYYRSDKKIANKEYMDRILDFIGKSNKSSWFSSNENFLIILGDTFEYKQSNDYWKGFIYKDDHWITIHNNN